MDFLLDLSWLYSGGFAFRFKSIKCCWQPSFFNVTTLLFIKFNEFIWIRALTVVSIKGARGEEGKEAKGNLSKSGRFADGNFKRLEIEASLQANWQRSESNQARFFEYFTRYPPSPSFSHTLCLALAASEATFNFQLATACCHATNSIRLANFGSISWQAAAVLFCCSVLLFCFDVRYFLSRTVANEKHSTLSQSNQIRGKYGRPAREASAKLLKLKSLLSISTWRATHLPDWCNKLALTGVSLSMRIIWISNYSWLSLCCFYWFEGRAKGNVRTYS